MNVACFKYQHCLYLTYVLLRLNFMKVKTKVQKWGNGLAIRISGAMRDIPRFKDGTPIQVEIYENGLSIKKICIPKKFKLPFTESELLNGMTPEKAHSEIIAFPLNSEY